MKIESFNYYKKKGFDNIIFTRGLEEMGSIITQIQFNKDGEINVLEIKPLIYDGGKLAHYRFMSKLRVPHINYFCPDCNGNHYLDSEKGWDHRGYGIYAKTIVKPDKDWIPNIIFPPWRQIWR